MEAKEGNEREEYKRGERGGRKRTRRRKGRRRTWGDREIVVGVRNCSMKMCTTIQSRKSGAKHLTTIFVRLRVVQATIKR